MPDRRRGHPQVGRGRHLHRAVAAEEATTAREQAIPSRGGPEAETVTEEGQRPTITLKNGAVVDVREAAAVWRDLAAVLETDPDEFRSLLALVQGRPADVNPRHFDELWADAFLENDLRTIRPVVREVLLNSYEADTGEGSVIAPLRLQDEADRPVAEKALAQRDQWVRDFASGKKDWGRSPD